VAEFEDQKHSLVQSMKEDRMRDEIAQKSSMERMMSLKNEELAKSQNMLSAIRQEHAAEVG
jgi:hypothetical protein